MLSHRTTAPQQGFSLMELSIIFVVLGAVLAMLLPRMIEGIGNSKIRETREILNQARDELIGLARSDGDGYRLPDPEGANSNELPASIVHRFDPWGNPLFYYQAHDLEQTAHTCFLCSTSTNMTKRGKTTNDVAFVLGSKGKNRIQDFDETTAPALNIPLFGRNGYDDIVQFATLEYVQNKLGGRQRSGMPDKDLLAWYRFDNNSPRDVSPNEYNATLGGMSVPTPGTDRFGCENSMYAFGPGAKIIVTNSTHLDRELTDDFSVAFWIRPQPLGLIGAIDTNIIRKEKMGGTAGYFIRLLNGPRQPFVWLKDVGSDGLRVKATQSLPQEEWSHVVVTYKGVTPGGTATVDNITLYINGANQTSPAAVPGYPSVSGSISCPAAQCTMGGTRAFDLDEVAFFNATLSPQEVGTMYNQTRPTVSP